MAEEYGNLPFDEQIEFFRQKLSLPTRSWRDIQRGQHARAFVVAGAMRDELLADLRRAVDKGIADGTTLEQFRKDFRDIVRRRGWTGWTGEGSAAGEAWRTRVIYDTNLRTSYHAGRYQQQKEAAEDRPYWRYRHSHASEDPREEHLSWDGKVLPHDDPWWSSHYPPNGWGCQCYVETLAERDLKRLGKDGPDERPTDPSDTTGIDEGWDYNVGEAAWGRAQTERLVEQYDGGREWESMDGTDYTHYGRPATLPASEDGEVGERLEDEEAVVRPLRSVLGGASKTFEVDAGDTRYPLHVDAEVLGRHVPVDRSPFLPLLPRLAEAPQEVWANFERSKRTGKVALRMRLIKVVETPDKDRPMALVADAQGGTLVAWTFLPYRQRSLNNIRRGRLLHAADEEEE
ncbi:MAG: phage minor head protein [Thiohalospira sp.]